MNQASIPIHTFMKYDFKRYIKPSKNLVDPYEDSRFQFKDIPAETRKADKLKNIFKKDRYKENEILKVFDDASLSYDCQRPHLLDFKRINLSNSQVTEIGIQDLADSPFAINIEEIDLSQNGLNVSDYVLRQLADSQNLSTLQIIVLTDTGITDIGIMYLFEPFLIDVELISDGDQFRQTKKMHTKRVTSANFLMSTGFKGVIQFNKLFSSKQSAFLSTKQTQSDISEEDDSQQISKKVFDKLPMLSVLVLYGNQQITDKSLKCIANSSSITKIKYLDLRATRVTDFGVIQLFQSPNCQNLQYLDLSFLGDGITSASIDGFSQSPFCKSLVVLKCKNSQISDSCLEELAESVNAQTLEQIDFSILDDSKKVAGKNRQLKSNPAGLGKEDDKGTISDKGLRSISRAKYLGKIEILDLSGQLISESSLQDFVLSDTFKTIKEFHCSNNFRVTNQLLESIQRSDKTKDLEKLYVTQTGITEEGVELFMDEMPNVEILHSITQIGSIRDRMKQNVAGIRCYCCEQCCKTFSHNLCFVCKVRHITSLEFPAKLCEKCGSEYKETSRNPRKCFFCKSTFMDCKDIIVLFVINQFNMVDKSFFHTSCDSIVQHYPNEKTLSLYPNIDFVDKTANFRINNLNLKITTHRLILTNHPNVDKITDHDTKNMYFLIHYNQIKNMEKKYTGMFQKKLDHIKIAIDPGQLIEFFAKNLEGPCLQLEAALEKQEWKKQQLPQEVEKDQYLGVRGQIKQKQQEIATTETTVSSSFKGNFEDLFRNASELQEISRFLKESLNTGTQQEQGDVNQILQQMGCFQVITKDEAGDNYYAELGKQIYTMCSELFPRLGGIISLLDVYYFFNRKRSTSLISPEEILLACKQFQRLGLKARVQVYENNVKVIESTEFNQEKDYENTFGRYMKFEEGISAEMLSKKLGISPLIVKIKLKFAINRGTIVIDNRIEGVRYYKNLILV